MTKAEFNKKMGSLSKEALITLFFDISKREKGLNEKLYRNARAEELNILVRKHKRAKHSRTKKELKAIVALELKIEKLAEELGVKLNVEEAQNTASPQKQVYLGDKQRLLKIMKELHYPEATMDWNIDADLGLSSSDMADLAIDVESEFNIYISDEELNRIVTGRDILILVEDKRTGGKQ